MSEHLLLCANVSKIPFPRSLAIMDFYGIYFKAVFIISLNCGSSENLAFGLRRIQYATCEYSAFLNISLRFCFCTHSVGRDVTKTAPVRFSCQKLFFFCFFLGGGGRGRGVNG